MRGGFWGLLYMEPLHVNTTVNIADCCSSTQNEVGHHTLSCVPAQRLHTLTDQYDELLPFPPNFRCNKSLTFGKLCVMATSKDLSCFAKKPAFVNCWSSHDLSCCGDMNHSINDFLRGNQVLASLSLLATRKTLREEAFTIKNIPRGLLTSVLPVQWECQLYRQIQPTALLPSAIQLPMCTGPPI